eukprot:4868534-Prymnesium_polylepis.1
MQLLAWDAEVQTQGCDLLVILRRPSPAHMGRAVSSTAVSTVVAALLAHPTDLKVQEAGLLMLFHCTYRDEELITAEL